MVDLLGAYSGSESSRRVAYSDPETAFDEEFVFGIGCTGPIHNPFLMDALYDVFIRSTSFNTRS